MRILSVSDFTVPELTEQFDREYFGEIDLIFSCGDLQPEYLTSLTSKFDVPLYYIKGNHDIRSDYDSIWGCTNIHAKIINFNNISILGLEGSLWYNGGLFQYTEQQMRNILWGLKIPIWLKKGIDIVITHAPPRHVHDGEDRCHMGFNAYQRLIKKYKPGYFIHGHIHNNFTNASDRVTLVNETQVINTCGYNILEFDHEHI
ncbi:MAG: hypothetical protein HOC24_16010 [Deltaproteobacteria bacterium]|jgi:uncharacterized protein|nr:hypothetical protein [Deltaproteobacteria bacterium]